MDSNKLLALQVEQLDKEKRDQTERLRIISRRIDHVERAFRKEEKALLSVDYEAQKTNDIEAYNAQKSATLKSTADKHKEELELKTRLGRMMADYVKARKDMAGKREEEFQRRRDEARVQIDKEKHRRREMILQAREEEKRARDEEELRIRQEADEIERQEQGVCARHQTPPRKPLD